MAKKKYSASVEDYIEAIHQIIAEKQAVRAKDIAKRLEVSNPSVTGALKHMAELGLINYAPYDVITLTVPGEKIAHKVIKKHETLTSFFTEVLALSPQEADAEACKVEHALSGRVLQRLIAFMEQISTETGLHQEILKLRKILESK